MRAIKRHLKRLAGFWLEDSQSSRVVPRTGYSAWLTLFCAAAMGFLAVFAVAFSLATGRLAMRWGDELARSSTIRISAPGDQMAEQTRAALRVLETTPGVAEARALSDEEQRALLAPWFGPDLPVETLPIPRLIEVIEDESGFDAQGLRLRLGAEVPGAVLDDHTRWRRPLIEAAQRLRLLGWMALLLIAGVIGAVITLAARASLAANAQVIAVLRLVGARDAYIARAFMRRFTARAFGGATLGTGLAAGAMLLLPSPSLAGGFLTGLGFAGWGWLWLVPVPPLTALVAIVATGAAARKTLRELP